MKRIDWETAEKKLSEIEIRNCIYTILMYILRFEQHSYLDCYQSTRKMFVFFLVFDVQTWLHRWSIHGYGCKCDLPTFFFFYDCAYRVAVISKIIDNWFYLFSDMNCVKKNVHELQDHFVKKYPYNKIF